MSSEIIAQGLISKKSPKVMAFVKLFGFQESRCSSSSEFLISKHSVSIKCNTTSAMGKWPSPGPLFTRPQKKLFWINHRVWTFNWTFWLLKGIHCVPKCPCLDLCMFWEDLVGFHCWGSLRKGRRASGSCKKVSCRWRWWEVIKWWSNCGWWQGREGGRERTKFGSRE